MSTQTGNTDATNAYTGNMTDSVDFSNSSQCPMPDSANGFPRNTPSNTIVTPITEASATLPGRILYIQSPVKSAAGIVAMMVNIPHALSLSAFTTTMPTLANVITMMNNVAIDVVIPDSLPILARALWGSESPSCRTEAHRITKSCTAP